MITGCGKVIRYAKRAQFSFGYHSDVNLFAELIDLCAATSPSDLLLSPGCEVQTFVDGAHRSTSIQFTEPQAEELLKICSLSKWPNDRPIGITLGPHRFRIQFYRASGQMRASLRLLPKAIPTPSELRIPQQVVNYISSLPIGSGGLLIFGGATGSGKSTSLASLIQHWAAQNLYHVVTIEDPVEYKFTDNYPMQFSQREVGIDTESWDSAIKSSTRMYPRLLYLAELDGPQSLVGALNAALTGCMVFTTLHTSSIAESISSLVKWIPPERMGQYMEILPTLLMPVVCQKLVPATTGGRVALHEVLMPTISNATYIRQGNSSNLGREIETGAAHGHLTFARSAQLAFQKGLITRATLDIHTRTPSNR